MGKLRDYIVPKIPAEWTGNRRTYAVMMQEVLDELHQYIKEDWLSESLREKINGGGTSKRGGLDYSLDVQDTGIKWLDGSAIKQVTQTFTVAANNSMDSNAIDNLGAIIDAKGYVITSGGACYPVGVELQVWKPGNGNTFKILSSVSGTANITVYFTEAEAQPTSDTWEYFRGGYVNDASNVPIDWSANLLTRPYDMVHGYTVYGLASLDYVNTNGYMLLHDATGASNYYNSHVCTTNVVTIPTTATKLIVEASRAASACNISLALLPNDAPNTMDTSNGGQLSGWFNPTTSAALYTMTLDSGIAGTSLYRIIVNYRGKGDVYRAAYITKVYFE